MLSQPVTWRTDEGRRMGEGHREVLGDVAFLLGVVDEGVQVVTDDLGDAGGGDRDHLRLVEGLGVVQAVDHVLLAAEHRCIFGHRVGDAGDRLLEVTVEVGAEVGDAALRTVDVGQGLVEAQEAQRTAPSGWQALAGLTVRASRLKLRSWYSLVVVQTKVSADLFLARALLRTARACRADSCPCSRRRGTAG